MDAPPVQYVTTSDGFNIAYTVTGEGRPVVLLPMFMNDLQLMWQEPEFCAFFEEISAHYKLIQFDGRGQGASSRGLGSDHTVWDNLHDLEALVQHLGLSRMTLIAASMFGFAAVPYAVSHPEQVEALILWQAGWDYPPGSENTFFPFAELARRSMGLFAETLTGANSFDPDLSYKRFSSAMTREDLLTALDGFRGQTLRPVLPLLHVPTLIIGSRSSELRPRLEESAREQATLVPGAQLVLFEFSRHYPVGLTLEGAPPAALAMQQFLSGLASGDGRRAGESVGRTDLSQRELEVLRLVAAGRSSREIGEELVLSRRTVERHVANIYLKTETHGRAQLATYALRNSLT